MPGFTFFVKPCPACGRSVRIALDYLGMPVRCTHCSRVFAANDNESQSESMNDPVDYWIKFSELEMDERIDEQFESRLPR